MSGGRARRRGSRRAERATVVTGRLAEGRDRRTKIVATIGPVSATEEALRALLQAGMDVARLNFSHGTPEEHRATIRRLRRLAEELHIPVGVLQDLAGPKVRIGAFAAGTIELHAGAPFTLTTRGILGDPEAVSVSYAGLPEAVAPGDRLLLADGSIELLVREVEGSEIRMSGRPSAS
jgi:pyruvate kinase